MSDIEPTDVYVSLIPLNETLFSASSEATDLLVGLEARLNTNRAGKYNGRLGCIVDVIPDRFNGFLALVMVFYADQRSATGPNSSAFLNGDSQTRSYWKISEIDLTGRRVYPCDQR